MYLARKNIGIPLDRQNRNNHNDNYKELYGVVNNIVGTITDEVYEQIIDGAKLNWKSPVDSENDLPTSANEGDAVMTRDDGKVYRYDGSQWQEIQQIDAGPVNEVDRRLTSQLADTAMDMNKYVSSSHLGLTNRKVPRGMITWIDDDGNVKVYDELYPVFKSKGVPLTVALTTNRINNRSDYMKDAQVRELHENGFEIMAHGHDHLDGTVTPKDKLKEEYKKVRDYLFNNGYNYRGIVYPYNRYDGNVDEVAREFFDYGLGSLADSRAEFAEPPLNMFRLRRYSLTLGKEEILRKITEAKEKNEWIVVYGHVGEDWESWDNGRKPDVVAGEIIDHALSEGLDFVHTDEAIRHHGNLLEIDRLNNIDKFGVPHGVNMSTVFVPPMDEFTADVLIDDYKRGITLQRIREAASEGLPDGSGLVITYKTGTNDAWSRQIYYKINSTLTLQRRPGVGAWTSWELVSDYSAPMNSYTANSKPSDYFKGTTINRVQSAQASGMPGGSAGVLTTVKPSNSSWAKQTYRLYKQGIEYIRTEIEGDEWGEWSSYGDVNVLTQVGEYPPNAPITAFPENKITYVKVTINDSGDYGLPTSGLIAVHRDKEDAYSYQKFVSRVTSDGRPILYRNWNHVNNIWRDWVDALGNKYND